MGRRPIGDQPLTPAERKRRSREGVARQMTDAQLCEVWKVSPSMLYLAKRIIREGLPGWHELVMDHDVPLAFIIAAIELRWPWAEELLQLDIKAHGLPVARQMLALAQERVRVLT